LRHSLQGRPWTVSGGEEGQDAAAKIQAQAELMDVHEEKFFSLIISDGEESENVSGKLSDARVL